MADELNIPTHRWYQPRNNIKLPSNLVSKRWILSAGVALIDAWINSKPWGIPIPALFAAGEPGVWYDPSDLTTLFQDAAGTNPVTAPAQPVGLVLDKSQGLALGPELVSNGSFNTGAGTTGWTTSNCTIQVVGNELELTSVAGGAYSQASTTISTVVGKKYVYAANIRRNQAVGSASITVGGITSGTRVTSLTPTNVQIIFTAAATTTTVLLDGIDASAGSKYSFSTATVKLLPGNHATQSTAASRPTYGVVPKGGRRNLLLATDTMATQSATVTAAAHTLSFTGTGTVTLTGASIAGPLIGTGAGNRVSLTFTPTSGSLTMTVLGSVTLAQLEASSTATAYQRVVSQYDVTEAGVQSLSYLSFDGVDDWLVTNTITPGTDKAQVFAGVRQLGNNGMIVEHSGSNDANNGAFYIYTGEVGSGDLSFGLRGSQLTKLIGSAMTPPVTRVVSGSFDIAGASRATEIFPRLNGAAASLTGYGTADAGTGNFLAYPLYIGRRGGTSLPFNGHIYSLITRFGANLTAEQITATETWVNTKTGAYL